MSDKALFKRKKKASLEEVKESGSILDRLDKYAEENEVIAFNNDNMDKEYLILPVYLDEVQSKELSRYFHTFTKQRIWVRTLLSRVGALLREKNIALNKLKDEEFSKWPQRMSITEKELKLYNNPETSKILDDLTETQEKYNMLRDYMDNLEDAIFNVSREITRRGADFESNRREDNINNIRRKKVEQGG